MYVHVYQCVLAHSNVVNIQVQVGRFEARRKVSDVSQKKERNKNKKKSIINVCRSKM